MSAGAPPDPARVFPASPLQQRGWGRDDGGAAEARVEAVLAIDGPVDHAAVAAAATRVVARHEVLRTRLRMGPSGLEQVVAPATAVEVVPLGAGDAGNAWATRAFAPQTGPLLRLGWRPEAGGGRLHVHACALVADLGTLEPFAAALAEALAERPEEPALQYGDVAGWLAHEARRSQAALGWTEHSAVAVEASRVSPEQIEARVDAATADALEAVARACGSPPAAAWLACWRTIVPRVFPGDVEPEWVVIDGRTIEELAGVAGPLTGPVQLHAPPRGELDLRQAIPLAAAALRMPPWHSPGAPPGGIAFGFVAHVAPIVVGDVRVAIVERRDHSRSAALELTCHRDDAGATLVVRYDPRRLDDDHATRLVGWYVRLLEAAAADPAAPLGTRALASPAELEQSVAALDGGPPLDAGALVYRRFERWAVEIPDSIAVIAGDEHVTYRTLRSRAHRLARWLVAAGVAPGAVVPLLLDRSVHEVVAVMATLMTGGAFLLLDPETPRARLDRILVEATPAVVVTQQSLAHLVPPGTATVLVDTEAAAIAAMPDTPLPCAPELGSAAYLVHTSGSTGAPKASLNTHRGLANYMIWLSRHVGITREGRVLRKASGGFDVGIWEQLLPLSVGASVVVAPPGAHRDLASLVRLIVQHGITIVHFVPSLLRAFLDEPDVERCVSLRHVLCDGEVVTVELRDRARARLPSAVLHNLWGATEAAIDVTCWSDPGGPWRGRIPVGSPVAGVRLHVVERDGRPVLPGMPGEIYVGGCAVALGYHRRPDLTAERFVPDPHGARGGRLYRVGDIVRQRRDGAIAFLGRVDGQIKLRGLRIEPGEVEAVLGALPGVRQVAVALRKDATGEPRLVGYIVADAEQSGGVIDPAGFLPVLSERLPNAMIPTAWVVLDALPRLPSGKIDRAALPSPPTAAVPVRGEPPRSPIETAIAAIWSRLLGVERFSTHDDFFVVGGHSLLAMRLVAELRDAFGVELPLIEVFERSRLDGLAEAVAERLGTASAREPIPTAPPSDRQRLSPAQEQLWLAQRLDPEASAYNVAHALRLVGPLDVDVLWRSLDALVERHAVLATTIVEDDGTPWQVRRPAATMELRVHALDDRERLGSCLAEETGRPFALDRDLPVRAALLRLAPDEHVLLVTLHHIACDEASVVLLLRDALALHAALAAGRAPALAPVGITYADFAQWQRSRLPDLEQRQLGYWKQRLAGPLPTPSIPGERAPGREPPRVGVVRRVLAGGLGQAVTRAGRELGVTPFVTYLSAFLVLLRRVTGEHDLIVGSPMDVRGRSDLADVVGMFVNLVPLRVDLGDARTFADVTTRARAATLGALAHREVPFPSIVAAVAPERDRSPLVRMGFALYEQAPPPLQLPGLVLEPIEVEHAAPKLDLLLTIDATVADPLVALEYDARRFDAETVEAWLSGWITLLTAAVAAPERPLAALTRVDDDARRSPGVAWAPAPPLGPGLLARLHAVAATRGDAIALEFSDGSFSFAGLVATATAIGRRLRAVGITPEARVGLLLEGSAWLVAALLGVLEAGGAFVPLHPSDPPTRLARIIEDAGVQVIVTRARAVTLPSDAANVVVVDLDEPAASPPPLVPHANDPPPAMLAGVLYTSGSTGRPKAVGLTHGGLLRLATGQPLWELAPGDRVAQLADPRFDAFMWEVFATLLAGARLVGIERQDVATGRALAERLRERGVTVALITTAVMHHVASEVPSAFASLRQLMFGGETVDPRILLTLREASPGLRLINVYGPTETTTIVACHPVTAVDPGRRVPIGRSIVGARLHVLDAERHELLPGLAGELCIGGDGVARGYLGRPGDTAASFLPDPFAPAPGQRMYATNDVARRLPDGSLDFLGRRDGQVKIRGYRVDPLEIEARLLEHPAVAQAVVLAVDAGPERKLVAHLVPAREPVGPDALVDFLRARMPAFLVPSGFVWHHALPITPRGKLDRAALETRAADGLASPRTVEPPRTPTEELVAAAWHDALGAMGRHESFFHRGGHSLMAARITARLGDALHLDIPLRLVFEAPTIARLAAAIDELRRGSTAERAVPRLELGPPPSRVPLALQQEQMWLFEQLLPGKAFFHIHAAFRVLGPLDPPLLSRSLRALAARHDALRTSFAFDDERGPAQVIAAEPPDAFEEIDLRDHTPGAASEDAQQLAARAARRPFDLAHGPLWRLTLIRETDDRALAILVVHHILFDGASLELLARELGQTYAALARGEPDPPPAPVQYGHFVRWQREHLTAAKLPAHTAYWRRVLSGELRPLALGTPDPRRQLVLELHRVETSLSAAEIDRLQATAAREGATLFSAVLAALGLVLAARTRQTDLRVSTLEANRHRSELAGVVGLLATMVILRLDLRDATTPLAALRRARDCVFGAFDHLELPFEELLAVLEAEATIDRSTLSQVMLVLEEGGELPLSLPGVTLEAADVDDGRGQALALSGHDLVVRLERRPEGTRITALFKRGLLDEADAAALVEELRRTLLVLAEGDR